VKILLQDWAARHYDPPPSIHTLRRWVREDRFVPPAELVGRSYYVEETAYLHDAWGSGGRPTLVERLKQGLG
jgi:hypothetical protein